MALQNDRVGLPASRSTQAEDVDGLTIGHRLMEAQEYELALKAYYLSASELGLNADVLSAIGSANLKLNRLNQSERILRTAVKQDPEFVPAWNNLGVVLMRLGKVAEAHDVFRLAFGLDNGNSIEIRDNLRLAEQQLQNIVVPEQSDANFRLVRRGNGRYLLLGNN